VLILINNQKAKTPINSVIFSHSKVQGVVNGSAVKEGVNTIKFTGTTITGEKISVTKEFNAQSASSPSPQ
jgi:hypothetical protein